MHVTRKLQRAGKDWGITVGQNGHPGSPKTEPRLPRRTPAYFDFFLSPKVAAVL